MPPLEPPQRRSDEAGADHPTTTRPPHPTAVEPPDAGEVVVAFDLGRPSGTMTLAARGELGRIWQLETTADRWAGLLHAATGAGVAWLGTLESLVPSLLEGGPLVALGRHEPTIRCHRDFNPENVLLDGAGVAVVVDWENSGPAAAEQELASALAEFVPDPAGTTTFLRAYRDAGGTATLRDRSSFAMTLAVQANLVAWYAARALDPAAAAEDRARSEHWIRDIAANVFTIDRIDGWLRAASAA